MEIDNVLTMIKLAIESMDSIPEKYLRSKGNDNGFEELFPTIAESVAKSISSTDSLEVIPQLNHHFPDIDLILNGTKYGIELKSRSNGTWTTNGNSVFESITNDDYEEIYLFFGSKIPKLNRLRVKFAPYWKTTKSIKVTHSPRFIIDISNTNNSVFKSKREYDQLRNSNEQKKIDFLQQYLKENSDGTKWYIASHENISPIYLGDLDQNEIDIKLAELFLLYPYDLVGRRSNSYKRCASYLLTTHYIFSHALRDNFSASGTFEYRGEKFPRVYLRLKQLSPIILQLIDEASPDFKSLLLSTWYKDALLDHSSNNLLEDYKKVLDKQFSRTNQINIMESFKKVGINKLSEFVFN